jgi:hypothetical protein
MGGFSDQLRGFKSKALGKVDAVHRKVTLDVGTSLVMKSPVGDAKYWKQPPPPGYAGGRFRANWQFGEGQINFSTTEKIDPAGRFLIAELTAKMQPGQPGRTFYLTNSLPYGKRLEDGWSRQAPNGMVRLTQLEFQPIVDAIAREEAK